MRSVNDKILVRVNDGQKDTFLINGVETKVPLVFENNYREKSPVIAQAISSNNVISEGDILLCHHNTFYLPSPYNLYDDIFSIPANGNIIFCKLNVHDGSLLPIYGNMLCEKVGIETAIPIPEIKEYDCVISVTNPGYCIFNKEDTLFTRPMAAYCIVYNWNQDIKRVHKCHESQVVGVLLKK